MADTKEKDVATTGGGPCRALDGKALTGDGSTVSASDASSPTRADQSSMAIIRRLWAGLSWLDRLLTPLIILSMILGVIIGIYAPNAKQNLAEGDGLKGVSTPLVVGLIVMMWPILTKVPYETLHSTFRTSRIWTQIGVSLVLNWIIGPFVMLGLAWATLPDLPTYRTGIILVGLARCIAMVMIWTQIARGDIEVCAILVIINSALQMVLFAPMAVFFISVISDEEGLELEYGTTALAVLIYLGIPLLAGVVTRFTVLLVGGRKFLLHTFLPLFGPLSLVGLLYTIIIIFAAQAQRILDNLGPTFRTFVPLILYFSIMWTAAFVVCWRLSQRYGGKTWGYEMAVVQAFTAGSNNFELAIAVAVAVYGGDSDQALAATIGPLVEVPVLLILSWVSLFLGAKLNWERKGRGGGDEEQIAATSEKPSSRPQEAV